MGGYSEIVDNLKAIGLKRTIVVTPRHIAWKINIPPC